MAGEIPFKKPVPEYRTIVDGIWSDLMNAWLASFEESGDNTNVRVDVKNLDGPLEIGRLKGLYQLAELQAGESIGVKILSSAQFKVLKVNAKWLQIRYVTASTGTFLNTAKLNNLNLVLDDVPDVFYETYKNIEYDDNDVIFSGDDEIDTPALKNGDDFFILATNNTSEPISSMLSLVGVTSAQVGNFGLIGTTQIEPTTEMSTYNGLN